MKLYVVTTQVQAHLLPDMMDDYVWDKLADSLDDDPSNLRFAKKIRGVFLNRGKAEEYRAEYQLIPYLVSYISEWEEGGEDLSNVYEEKSRYNVEFARKQNGEQSNRRGINLRSYQEQQRKAKGL
jgi:hypothetical protein